MNKQLNIAYSIVPVMRPSESEWLRTFNRTKKEVITTKEKFLINLPNPFERGIIIKDYK